MLALSRPISEPRLTAQVTVRKDVAHTNPAATVRPRASVCAKKSSKFNYEFEIIYVVAGTHQVDQELQIFLSDFGANIKCCLGDMNGI